ncbi:MAG: hypothetical protein R2710_31445, partial [Acidimicrobiales bacterium]
QRIADLHGQVDHLGGPLPTRLREIEAQILGQASDNATVSVAADRFTEVAAEWEVQQERLRAAKTLRGLASGPLYHLGRYRHGQERLAHASQLAVTQSFDYGITVGLKARFDALCGDLDAYEHSVALAQPVITESGIGWLEGSLQWAAAHAAGWRHDAAGVDRAFRNAQHMLGGLYDTDTGVVLAAEVATIFAALGQHDRARRCLAAIADRADQNRMEYRLAELIVTARAGGLDQAVLLWHDLDRSGIVPVDRRWRAQLELIAAGWAGSGTPTVADIEAEAARLGLADLPSRLAPALFDHDAAMHIHLLGRFAITTTEGELDLPTGQVPELVKLLAVHDGQMTIGAVCDSLWPDADIKLGLRRLKNLVAKTRHHLGNDALIRRPDTLALASNITTDIAEFTRASNDSVARQRKRRRGCSAVRCRRSTPTTGTCSPTTSTTTGSINGAGSCISMR